MTRQKPTNDLRDLTGLGFLVTWRQLDRIEHKLDQLLNLETHEMATIQELLDDENVETAELAQLVTVVQSQTDMIATLQQAVADLQANAGQLTPEQQAQLDAVNAAQDANRATIESLLPPAPPV